MMIFDSAIESLQYWTLMKGRLNNVVMLTLPKNSHVSAEEYLHEKVKQYKNTIDKVISLSRESLNCDKLSIHLSQYNIEIEKQTPVLYSWQQDVEKYQTFQFLDNHIGKLREKIKHTIPEKENQCQLERERA